MDENPCLPQTGEMACPGTPGWQDELFVVLDRFPIPIEVFAADGTSRFVNHAFTEVFGISADRVVGRLNVLSDPFLTTVLGFEEHLLRAFAGEPASLHNVRVPLEEIRSRYQRHGAPAGGVELYQDITALPLREPDGALAWVVVLFVTKDVYQFHSAVGRAREYLDSHWLDAFDLDAVATAAGVSRSHLSRLFGRYLGKTPYRYYQDTRVEQLKTALADPALQIGEAFVRCGAGYNSGLATAFRRAVGMTPSEYRRRLAELTTPRADPAGEPPDYRQEDDRLFRIVDLLPIPIQVFRADGRAAFINRAVLREWNVPDDTGILDSFNLLTDPLVNQRYGLRQYVTRAFAGETGLVPDVRIPLEAFWEVYQKGSATFDTEALYADILNFSLRDPDGRLRFVVSIFFTNRIYRGRREVARAREYLENHWRDRYDAGALAEVAGLSSSQLCRLFRQEAGTTPYAYYCQVRLERLKAALKNPDRSIAQAFAACGLEHQGNATRFFKENTGMTPSQYRALAGQE
ncbi:MAG: helix-turn-helix domain-containing protein [Propionicimonas sp.]|nr:helix-turn-helix domain-containing protein [Propionicimonas sp.]